MADGDTAGLPYSAHMVGEAAAARDSRRWTSIGLAALVLTFGVSVAWSALAPLSSAVVAPGVVKVESNRKKIQHPDGGVIGEILVRDGALVNAGDVLVRMDPTRAASAHGVVVGGRDAALATMARLTAERDDLRGIVLSPQLIQRRADPQVELVIRAQEALFIARRNARDGEVAILEQQIESQRKEILGFESQRKSKQDQLESLAHDLKALKELEVDGMVEKVRVRGVEREVFRLTGERDELVARIDAARLAISEKELRKFQVRKAFREDVANELKKVQSEQMELIERESTSKRTLDLIDLRAPVAGVVTDLKVHTAGGVVAPGEVLLEIVPSADRLSVEARVLPQDIDRVALGQVTGVKLHAFESRTTPELNGAVSYVAADAVVDPRTEQSTFLVRIEVSAGEIARLGPQQRLQAGMQADVFIRTGERTFWGYLMQPLVESFSKAWRER